MPKNLLLHKPLRGESAPYRCVVVADLAELALHQPAWLDLMGRALEDNVYMHPAHVMATLRHFHTRRPFRVVFVYRRDPEAEQDVLVACAPFTLVSPTLRRPIPNLATLISPHPLYAYPMVDRLWARPALRALWDWLSLPDQPFALVLLDRLSNRSATWALIQDELALRGQKSWSREVRQRPVLHKTGTFEEYLALLPRRRRQGDKRRLRRLRRLSQSSGAVEFRLHRDLQRCPDLAERFMHVEQRSWKGRQGTALLADPHSATFFREMVQELGSRGQIFFVELLYQGAPIAVSANFVHRETLFAYKVGYDPTYADFSPGMLVQRETVRCFFEAADLRRADSGNKEPSYLDAYYRELVDLHLLCISTPKLASQLYIRLMPLALGVKSSAENRFPFLKGRRPGHAHGQEPGQAEDREEPSDPEELVP